MSISLAGLPDRFLTRSGISVQVRPLAEDDSMLVEQFIRSLSDESRYNRLLGPPQTVTSEYAARLSRVSYPREVALAALTQVDGSDQLIGVARYAVVDEGHQCELALAVSDAWHGQGIGKALLRMLVEVARAQGLRAMLGYVLATNTAMRTLCLSLGFGISRVPDDATLVEVTLQL